MNPKRKEDINRDLRQLIKSVTGFDRRDENFKLCVDFAESNFKYHRFLSPDSHKIERDVQGLCEKFRVHSQLTKADDLKDLVKEFLDEPGFEGRDYGKTDTHYALLSLLTELAENPTGASYERKIPTEHEEEVDDFDWRGYLLEAQDLCFISYASSESEEDELSEDGDKDKEVRHVAWVEQVLDERSDSSLSDDDQDGETKSADIGRHPALSGVLMGNVTSQNNVNDFQYLEQNLMVEYWKGKAREENGGGDYYSSNLAKDWQKYQHNLNGFQTKTPSVFVTEKQVMRETLWMLSGVHDLFIFSFENEKFDLNPDVYMSHLTPESLSSFLKPLMEKGSQVIALHSFVKEIMSTSYTFRNSGLIINDNNNSEKTMTSQGQWSSIPISQTYQSFADRLWLFLTEFKKAVRDEEQSVMAQEEVLTLYKMSQNLRLWLSKVQLVHEIFTRGIAAAKSTPDLTNAGRSSLLLNTLYQVLHETDPLCDLCPGSQSELVLSLLLYTSRPLMDITSSWITHGNLSDPSSEFVVQRNKQIKSLDETFWEKAFVSQMEPQLPETSGSKEVAGGQSDASKNTLSSTDVNSVNDSNKKTTRRNLTNNKSAANDLHTPQLKSARHKNTGSVSNLSENIVTQNTDTKKVIIGSSLMSYSKEADFRLQACPVFLQTAMKDTLVTGKSMEVLENLGLLDQVLPEQQLYQGHYSRPKSLFELLVEDLNKSFPLNNDNKDEEDEERIHSNTKDVVRHNDVIVSNLLNHTGIKDHLLEINFAAIFPQQKSTQVEPKDNLDLKLSSPLASNVLRHCESFLHNYAKSRYNVVCPRLVDIFKTQYKLLESIHAVQRYYLMSDGDIMMDFCYPVFAKISNKEHWQDPLVLDMYLHEAIGHRYPEDTDRLTVEVLPDIQPKGPINVTDCIRLKYHVPWPVDLVFSAKCEQRYHSIFSFLMQIKRAKSSLEQLRFETLSRDEISTSAFQFTGPLGVPQIPDSMDSSTRIHRAQLLRFRLLYFVNSLHNYIMTRILHTSGLEFAHRLRSATDLDQIISIHASYVDIIHERCLLTSRLTTLRDTVIQVLNLALTCSSLWLQGVQFIKGSAIQEMELKLTRCINFLSSFLTNVIKRGSFPHLESLAVSLISMQ